MNKEMAKKIYKDSNILTPTYTLVTKDNYEKALNYIFHNYLYPLVLKPNIGIDSNKVININSYLELKNTLPDTLDKYGKMIVEEFIRGHDVNCTVIDKARGTNIYALIPQGSSNRLESENKRIEEISKLAHNSLGLRHYSSSDFRITPKGKIYILKTNSQPVFHEDSLVNQSLKATGWQSRDFVDHVLSLVI
jgi:D-alanine-D-alanine ligase-like ATP-grasp enzyme